MCINIYTCKCIYIYIYIYIYMYIHNIHNIQYANQRQIFACCHYSEFCALRGSSGNWQIIYIFILLNITLGGILLHVSIWWEHVGTWWEVLIRTSHQVLTCNKIPPNVMFKSMNKQMICQLSDDHLSAWNSE